MNIMKSSMKLVEEMLELAHEQCSLANPDESYDKGYLIGFIAMNIDEEVLKEKIAYMKENMESLKDLKK